MKSASTEPTDLELMMFADGELDEARRAEVEAFLDRAAQGRLKLKAMGIVGEVVRRDADRVASAYRADDIASKVMAAIEAGRATTGDASDEIAAPSPTTAERRARVARATSRVVTESAEIVDAEPRKPAAVAPIAKAPARDTREAPRGGSALVEKNERPANDNARIIYGLAAFAAAAAVALGVWSRGPGPAPLPPDRMTGEVADTAAPPATNTAEVATTAGPAPAGTAANAAEPASDGAPGVEVASINWGENKPGAVYYVPSDDRGATTTVVWLASE